MCPSTANLIQNQQRRKGTLTSTKQMVLDSVEMSLLFKANSGSFCSNECTFLTMHNNQMKSKQIHRNLGKIGVPELNLHPVHFKK